MIDYLGQQLGYALGLITGAIRQMFLTGLRAFLDLIEEALAPLTRPFIDYLLNTGTVPPEIRPLLEEARQPRHFAIAPLLIPLAMGALGGLISGAVAPTSMLTQRTVNKTTRPSLITITAAVDAWFRGIIPESQLNDILAQSGYDDNQIDIIKTVSHFYPSPSDLINWQAKEVFEPDQIGKYGLDQEFGEINLEPFRKAGMTDDQTLNFWRAHWQAPSWTQVTEMMHRGVIDQQDMFDFYRLVEITPYWRDKMTAISYNPLTRVDARRMWALGVLDDEGLAKSYRDQGYTPEDANKLTLFSKLDRTLPDLRRRYANGWINADDLRSELIALGLTIDIVEKVWQTVVKADSPARTATERNLTRTDITNGYKKSVITREQAIELLIKMGYDDAEANYILELTVPSSQTAPAITQKTLTKADIINAIKQGVFTEQQGLDQLTTAGYSIPDAQTLIQLLKAQATGPKPPAEREISKADIVSAVKKGIIEGTEGYQMLIDIGYTDAQATFLLTLPPDEPIRSPSSFQEFNRIAEAYKTITAQRGYTVSQQTIDLEKAYRLQQVRVTSMRRQGIPEADLAPALGDLAEAEARYRKSLIADQQKAAG